MLRRLLACEITFPLMVRRVFSFAWALVSGLSLLLCVATIALLIWAGRNSVYEIGYQRHDGSFVNFEVPPLSFAIDLAVLPASWLAMYYYRRRQAKRNRIGICHTCGYDLRATPDRCPECGTVPTNGEA